MKKGFLILFGFSMAIIALTGCTSIFGEMSDSEKAALRAEVISLAKQGTAAAAKIYITQMESDGKIDASTAEELTKIADNIAAGTTPAVVETETPATDTTGADSPAAATEAAPSTPAATTTAE